MMEGYDSKLMVRTLIAWTASAAAGWVIVMEVVALALSWR